MVRAKLLEDGVVLHLFCSSIAGFVAAVIGSPVDVLKTRVMNAPAGKYAGIVDCIAKTYKEDGVKAFYKGFNANAQRIVTWNIAMFVTLEKIRSVVRQKYYSTGAH